MSEKKEIVKTFRCTPTESQMLQERTAETGICESEYIRREVFKNRKIQFPVEIRKLLEELKYLNLKIGNNINQVVRSCNSKKFIGRDDYAAIVEEMIKLEDAYDDIYQRLSEKMEQSTEEGSNG